MPKKLDDCVKEVKKKISKGEIKKTYKCDSKGKSNPRGKKRCKTSAWGTCKASIARSKK